MGRDFLPKDWIKKLGLLKINLLPKNTTLLVNFFTSYCYKFSYPASRTKRTYNNLSLYQIKYFCKRKI